MSIEKRTGTKKPRWRVRWREGGKHHSRTFSTRKDAVEFEASVNRRAELGAHAPGPVSTDQIGAWLDAWQRLRRPEWAETTYRQRDGDLKKWVRPLIGHVSLKDFGPQQARAFRALMQDMGATPNTQNRVMRVLSAALGDAVANDMIPANPCAGIRPAKVAPKRPRALTPDQIEAIRAAMTRVDDRLIVSLIGYAGLRPGEVCGLTWGQIGTDAIVVDRSAQLGKIVTTKTGKTRTVALIAPLADELAAFRRGRHDDALVVPDAQHGSRIRNWHNWSQRQFKPAARAAGVRCVPYDLRHSFASLLIHEGRSIGYVSAQMGHASQTLTLQHYSHWFDEAALRTRAGLSELVADARGQRTAT